MQTSQPMAPFLQKRELKSYVSWGVVQDIFDTEAKATKCLECRYPKSKIFYLLCWKYIKRQYICIVLLKYYQASVSI